MKEHMFRDKIKPIKEHGGCSCCDNMSVQEHQKYECEI